MSGRKESLFATFYFLPILVKLGLVKSVKLKIKFLSPNDIMYFIDEPRY